MLVALTPLEETRRSKTMPSALLVLVRVLTFAASVRRACAGTEDAVSVYFGSGCFWHVQHEFIAAEQQILKRNDSQLTALVGYAGGTKLNADGNACYGDYEELGHTEVVRLTLPVDKLPEFAGLFWSLFKGVDRVDTMDRGPAYRAALGLPGGMASPLLATVSASQAGRVSQPFRMEAGRGDDADTLGTPLVWVYDTALFPFYQAELYHQFHDDFMAGGQYPDSYNSLHTAVLDAGGMKPTGCPDGAVRMSAGSAVCVSMLPFLFVALSLFED